VINVITDKQWILKLKPVRKRIPNKELLRALVRWQNNSDPNDLGIIRFGFELFPHKLKRKYGTAPWVRTAFSDVLRYSPEMMKIDRSHAICTYRDGSKSTWFADIFPLYATLVGEYGIYWRDYRLPLMDYIRIRAKTQEEAEKRITNATSEFTLNDQLISLFGNLEPTLKEVKDRKLKNQAKLLMLLNGNVYQAQGLNRPSRGANVRGKRPKLDINDDVENKENTKTAHQRKENAKEILSEQFGGLAHDGLTIYIGNYVHEDCLMKHLLKNPGWHPQYYQITYFDKNGVEKSSWEARYTMKYIRALESWYKGHEELGGYKLARMEFWNEIISDKDYQVKWRKGRYVRKNDMNWIELEDSKGDKKLLRAYIVISGDPAISKEKRASFPAITFTAFCSDGNRYILGAIHRRLDINDRYYNESDKRKVNVIALTTEELGYIKERGMVQEMARAIIRYKADGFVLENAGQQLAWYNDLDLNIIQPLGIKVDKMWYHPKDEKVYKLETQLLNWFSAGKYYILNDAPNGKVIEAQIKTFPDSKLDILDALHNAEVLGRTHLPKKGNITATGSYYEETYGSKGGLDAYVPPPGVEPYVLF
jgi:hypothetical protein